MAARRKSSTGSVQDARTNEAFLKQRVEELETEVNRLKGRLDQLRKAKNTTVLKREREVVNIQEPNFNRRDSKLTDTKTIELEGKLSESNAKVTQLEQKIKVIQDGHRDELFELSRKQLEEINAKMAEKVPSCAHNQEIELLNKQILSLNADKSALRFENGELVGRIQEMYEDLSIKEAKWCEKEDEYKTKLSVDWQEKYSQWMGATEAKLEELQSANAFLSSLVQKQKPKGKDPSGQDSN